MYDDQLALDKALDKLTTLPPLVTATEVERLRRQLEDVAEGRAFLLQGGDCAESFADCASAPIEAKVKVLLQMSLIMVWGARIPVVRVARMAGQYAKPRSSPTELYQGRTIPSFRGENVNGFDPDDRRPDPERLIDAYFHSAATLNHLRALLASGFADLHHPDAWNLDWVQNSEVRARYSEITERLLDCLSFMGTIGVDDAALQSADIYTSHEGLMLEYEQTQTRTRSTTTTASTAAAAVDLSRSMQAYRNGTIDATDLFDDPPPQTEYYNLGAHFLWIGDRTRQLDGAHVEYFRGLENPIGLKVGPTMSPEELVRALDILDPLPSTDPIATTEGRSGGRRKYRPGKVTLITRYGAGKVRQLLPLHIAAVQRSGHVVVWSCDPMHGNTRVAASHPGLKTRFFDDILSELEDNLAVHAECGSLLNGVHFEMTGEAVTECLGGGGAAIAGGIETDRYQTACDPRLNYEQAMELAFLIASHWRKQRRPVVAADTHTVRHV